MRRFVTSSLAGLLAVATLVAFPAFGVGAEPRRTRPKEAQSLPAAQSPTTTAAVREEADWILSAQLPDGAIAHYPDKVAIWPYLSNFAAVGLVQATKVTGNTRYLKAAWRWLQWYQAHQSPEGFVTDYRVGGDGTLASTGDMDSTDAYAGTFLYAVWRAYDTSRDRAALKRLRPGIDGAVRAIEGTLDADGLTWAKPAWRVKYLMDQAEVYVGLRAAANLKNTLGDKTGARRASSSAARLKAAVERLWNLSLGAYDWAVHESGARDATTWPIFYPDAQQQMWAVAFGLTDTLRSSELVGRFSLIHPNWDEPNSTWSPHGEPRSIEYWPVSGWAFIRAGRTAEAAAGAEGIRSAAVEAGRAWPYTPAIAGQLIVLLTGGPALPPD